METINSSTKCYRIESTPNRKMASAMWRRAKFLGLPVRGWMDGQQCRVQIKATEWTVWRIVCAARSEVEAAEAEALVAQVKDEIAASVPEYFDDGWASDRAIMENPRVMELDNLPFLIAICDAARAAGHEADYWRVEGSGRRYRLEVWDCGREEFSAILEAASRGVAHAVAVAA